MKRLIAPLAIILFFLFDILAIGRFKYIGMIPAQLLGLGIAGYFLILLVLPQFRATVRRLINPWIRKALVFYFIFVCSTIFLFFVTALLLHNEVAMVFDTIHDVGVTILSVLLLGALFIDHKKGRRGTLDRWLMVFLGIWAVEYGFSMLSPIPIWLWGWIYGIDFIVYFCWLVMITQIIQQRYDSGVSSSRLD